MVINKWFTLYFSLQTCIYKRNWFDFKQGFLKRNDRPSAGTGRHIQVTRTGQDVERYRRTWNRYLLQRFDWNQSGRRYSTKRRHYNQRRPAPLPVLSRKQSKVVDFNQRIFILIFFLGPNGSNQSKSSWVITWHCIQCRHPVLEFWSPISWTFWMRTYRDKSTVTFRTLPILWLITGSPKLSNTVSLNGPSWAIRNSFLKCFKLVVFYSTIFLRERIA